jgi:O-antigen ligase
MVFYYLGFAVSRQGDGRRYLILALLGLATFEALYGLFQDLTGWQQIFSYRKIFNVEEATGTYINRNHFAGFLEMVLPFALGLAHYYFSRGQHRVQRRRRQKRFTLPRSDGQKALLCLLVASTFYVAIFLSRSRMGIIATLVSTLVIAVLLVVVGEARRVGFMSILGFLSATFLVSAWIGLQPVVLRFEQMGGLHSADRLGIWKNTLQLILRNLWTGTGGGTFGVAYTAVQEERLDAFISHAHNDYLQLSLELGVPGALLLFGSVAFLLFRLTRQLTTQALGHFQRSVLLGSIGAITALLIHSITDFNLYIPANGATFCLILGMACSALEEKHDPRHPDVHGMGAG